MRLNTPSVTTSIRLSFEVRTSRRERRPIVWPTRSPRLAAIRSAAARAAMRRGSTRMSLRPSSQGWSSRASGTRVVLPAPGGAEMTRRTPLRSSARIGSITSSMGRSVGAGMATELSAEGAMVDQHLRADHDQDKAADDLRLRSDGTRARVADHHAEERHAESHDADGDDADQNRGIKGG